MEKYVITEAALIWLSMAIIPFICVSDLPQKILFITRRILLLGKATFGTALIPLVLLLPEHFAVQKIIFFEKIIIGIILMPLVLLVPSRS